MSCLKDAGSLCGCLLDTDVWAASTVVDGVRCGYYHVAAPLAATTGQQAESVWVIFLVEFPRVTLGV